MAQLKQLVNRPDVVEMHDATAQDPKLLIHLKVCGRREREPFGWGWGGVLEGCEWDEEKVWDESEIGRRC